MSMTQPDVTCRGAERGAGRAAGAPAPPGRWAGALVRGLGVDRIGAVYVWLGISWSSRCGCPTSSSNVATAKQILNANAITALAALAVIIPLATRTFDLSFAFTMTLSGVAAAHFVAVGMPLGVAVLLGVLIGAGIGVINAHRRRDDAHRLVHRDAGDRLADPVADHDGHRRHADPGHQAAGRLREDRPDRHPRHHAAGLLRDRRRVRDLVPARAHGDRPPPVRDRLQPRRARLAGVRVERLRFMSLVASGTAGRHRRRSCSPPRCSRARRRRASPYLLPAFAAAFLGATQLKHGRFNAWGTIIAVLLLGTGTTGLGLASAPQWAANMFVGVVLIAALAVTGIQRRATGAPAPRRGRGRLRPARAG